ncbi:MAG: UPF0280 family protein [Treponemataceae bacterium]|nr:UPF0280 family protein [Treponemataceae bacterium]
MERGRFFSLIIKIEETDLWLGWKGGVFSPPPSQQEEEKEDLPEKGNEKNTKIEDNLARRGKEGPAFFTPSFEEKLISQRATHIVQTLRKQIQDYGARHPAFFSSLVPLPFDPEAPLIVQRMLRAAQFAGVGPMAAVAGAIAGILGEELTKEFAFEELVIENGGDYWIWIQEPLLVGIYAGLSSLSGKIAVRLQPSKKPWGLACSSGTVGPSLSFGKADAVVVLTADAAAADAWATALGNLIKRQDDMEEAISYISSLGPKTEETKSLSHCELSSSGAPHSQKTGAASQREALFFRAPGEVSSFLKASIDCLPQGALCIMADRLAAWGNLELVPWDGSWEE